ncbi:hypothetical protein PRIC1_007920 [Phytophthora ramorum]
MSTPDKSVADVEVAQALEALAIPFQKHEHRELPTTEDVVAEIGHLPGLATKNLVFKDKKEGLFLVTAAPETVVDTKKLGARLHGAGVGGKKWNLRFASEDVLHGTLKALVDTTLVNCHPLRNDQTYAIKAEDLLKFVRHYKHEPIIVDFAAQEEAPAPAAALKAPKAKKEDKKKVVEQKTNEGMSVTKKDNFADWYTDAITKSGMIDYYDVSGCYILRPYSYEIWEKVQQFLDRNLKAIGVKNCYFPISDMKDPIAIRPTSETIMYPAFKNWIRSHRDLPMKLNQWNNVVRWEFKNPTPFIRTREFLWQEGHTAHATKEEADEEVRTVLNFYAACYEELLAVPMVKGVKTEKEKFAGADYTTTIEGFIPSTGRGIQAATSHMLGQNFGKMFGISAEYEDGKKLIPWQNSWGFTTRSLGVMIMVHGDDKGLVLPPRVAPVQVIVVPIPFKNQDEVEEIFAKADEIVDKLAGAGVRIEADKRRVYTPGWKYNHWELKGVPLRFEVGPKDIAKKQIQADMLERATKTRDSHTREITEWKDFVPALQDGCMALTPFCDEIEWEEIVKTKSREESLTLMGLEDEAENTATSAAAKTLCIPYKKNEESPVTADTKCFISGKPAKCWVLWGRSY